MQYWLRLVLAVSLLGLILVGMFSYTLDEGFQAVVTRFGEPVQVEAAAGLHFKWPWPVDRVYELDCRKKVYNTRFTQTLTKDKKSIILLTYIVWRVERPLLFLQSVGNSLNAEEKIEGLVTSAKNNVLGNYELNNLVSTEPERLKLDEIERRILEASGAKALESFGIEIVSLGIKRLAYPENNVQSVFNQMQAERGQYAAKYRAEGRMEASIILSETDVEIAKINAEAVRRSAEIKGDADRQAAEIYAAAHRQGREFYRFNRSLEALEAIVNNNAVFVLRSDQAPFNVLSEEIDEKRDKERD